MTDTWFIGDLHFGHRNIITFDDDNGKKIRPFSSIEEHDETLITNINALVRPQDRLYILGDICISRKNIPMVSRLNGRKKLIKGNHDIFKLKDYLPYFDDICAYRTYPEHGIICSHIPVHPQQLEHRFKWNVHGHMHANKVKTGQVIIRNDERYINVCPEHTFFKPVNFDQILKKIEVLTVD